MIIDSDFGKGEMKYLEVQKGLFINQMDIYLNDPLYITRKSRDTNDYFILNFHLSTSYFTQKTPEKDYKLGFENINILLSSSTTEADIFIPDHQKVQIFNIGFTYEWLQQNILSEKKLGSLKIFETNKPNQSCTGISY